MPVIDSAPERARRLKEMEIRLQGGGGVKYVCVGKDRSVDDPLRREGGG